MIDFSKEDPFFDSTNRVNGVYLLFTDGKMGMTATTGTEFEFHGMLGTQEVVNEKYLIGNDRCHVSMLSGKKDIIVR
ncbi:MAG: hypothetical protein WCJ26_15105 [bacterium]